MKRLLVAAAVLAPLVACSDGKGTDAAPLPTELTPPPSATAASNVLVVSHFTYNEITVAPGAKVEAKDLDSVDHTVTSSPAGLFDVTVTQGESSFFTAPSKQGRYDIVCRFHASMKGTLIVS